MSTPQRPRKTFEKTVSLFRLVGSPNGSPQAQQDWQQLLQGVGEAAMTRFRNSTEFDGAVGEYDGEFRLVLSRDRGNAPRQQEQRTGRKEGMPIRGAGWNVIEEGFASFVGIGNVFAYARSSVVAPQPKVVAEWVNRTRITPGITWEVMPLVDPDRYRRITDEGTVTTVDVVARPAVSLDGSGSLILRNLARFRELGDIKVEVKVTTTTGASNRATRQALRDQALAIIGGLGEEADQSIEKAKVKLVGDPDPIDLIEHHLTAKRTVELVLGERYRSLNEAVVFRAMDGVVDEYSSTIQRIIGPQ